MGIWHSRQTTSLCGNRFHHRLERSHCFSLSLFRQATLSWILPCELKLQPTLSPLSLYRHGGLDHSNLTSRHFIMSRLGDCEMENMKAVQIHNYGGPEVLHFEDAPRPTPGSGELLIRVHAASVNAIDWKARAGYLKDIFTLPLPYIPGWDVSGIVEAIGPGVTQFKKGDAIYAGPDGARSGKGPYAEYVVVKETEAALKPKSINHIHAAAIPVVALTALAGAVRPSSIKQGSEGANSR